MVSYWKQHDDVYDITPYVSGTEIKKEERKPSFCPLLGAPYGTSVPQPDGNSEDLGETE